MEETGCEIICGAPTTLIVKESTLLMMLMMIMMMSLMNSLIFYAEIKNIKAIAPSSSCKVFFLSLTPVEGNSAQKLNIASSYSAKTVLFESVLCTLIFVIITFAFCHFKHFDDRKLSSMLSKNINNNTFCDMLPGHLCHRTRNL